LGVVFAIGREIHSKGSELRGTDFSNDAIVFPQISSKNTPNVALLQGATVFQGGIMRQTVELERKSEI
jgi:hypothetical protein